MTVGRSTSSVEDEALAKCAELTRVSPATALVKGKLLEASHDDSERVLARLAQVYAQLGLTAEATRVSQRVQELQDAPILEVSETGFDDVDLEWDEATIAGPGAGESSLGPPLKPPASSLPPPPRPPPAKGSLPPPPAPPPGKPSGSPLPPAPAPPRPPSSRPPPAPAPPRSPSSRPPPAPAPPRPPSSRPPPAPPPPKATGSQPPPAVATAPAPSQPPPAGGVEARHVMRPPSTPPSAPPPRPAIAPTQPKTIEAAPQRGSGKVTSDEWERPSGNSSHWARHRWWYVGGAAAVLLASFCGYSSYVDHRLRVRLADIEQQLSIGTPDALAGGHQELEANFKLSWPVRIAADLIAGFPADRLPTDVEASILGLEHAVTLRLLGQPYKGNLKDTADHAERLGAPPDRVAFARIQHALDQRDQQKALSLVQAWDEKTAKDAYFQLAAGAAQARAGKVADALKRYDTARELLPASLTPLLLAAELAVSEAPASAEDRLTTLDQYDARIAKVSARALRGLRWALQPVDDGPRLLPEDLRLAEEQYQELPERLRYVPAIIRVKEAVIAAAPVGEALARGLAGARQANIILTLGRVALTHGKSREAKAALKLLREAAPHHPELGRFGLNLALSTNDVEQARSILKGDATGMAIVEAVFAYERLDMNGLKAQLSLLKDKPRAEALLVAGDVLTGKNLLGAADKSDFEDSVWGWPIQVDAALYRGDLSRAEQLLQEWNEPGTSAYLARKAQLARYQGDADTALKLARRGKPEQHARAFREELLALVAAGKADEAFELVDNKERSEVLGPLEKWTQHFVKGKARGPRAALGTIGYLPMPGSSTPIPVRVIAARAMFTSGDLRYKDIDVLLEAVIPKHPEFALARRDLDEE
jgi:hypothetical protein